MKKIFLSLFCFASISFINNPISLAQEKSNNASQESQVSNPKVSFQDLVFGEGRKEVKRKMSKFKFSSENDVYIKFTGKIAMKDVEIFTCFTPKSNKLWKISVDFVPPDKDSYSSIKRYFDDCKEALIKKYGEPYQVFNNFLSPYYDGDGFEVQAIRLEKAIFSCFWKIDDNDICCSVKKYLEVNISYESQKMVNIYNQEKSGDLMDSI